MIGVEHVRPLVDDKCIAQGWVEFSLSHKRYATGWPVLNVCALDGQSIGLWLFPTVDLAGSSS